MEYRWLIWLCLAGLLMLFLLMRARIGLIWKAVINTLCGFAALLLINVLGLGVGLRLGFNLLNGLVIGCLGLPGAAALVIVRLLLGA